MYIQHYAWVLKKRLWLIILGMLLCVGATVAITTVRHPVFEATATIEVSDPGNDVFSSQADAVTFALQVTNASVLQTAAGKLPGTTVASLENAVSAFPIDNTQLIAVQADASTPQQAVAIANTVAQVFIQQTLASETKRLHDSATQLATQVATARANMDQAQQQLTELQDSGAPADQIQIETGLLETYQSDYDTLSASYSNIQTQETLISGSLNIDQLATLPTGPNGISKGLSIALAASLSLLLMLILVLLLDWIDMTIKTPEDIARMTRLETLGSIPVQRSVSPSFSMQGMSGGDDPADQAFTVISAHFNALYRGQRALLVTSLHHANGTSTTATWLALALAQSGTRVLLIDANMRRPTLHETFHVVNTRGLTNTLGDTYTIQKQPAEIVPWLQKWMTQIPNLWLLPAGPASVSPTTVLRSLELQKLITWLLQEPEEGADRAQKLVDIIIFDAPAVLEEADATALALLCDSTVLVIEAARDRKETITKASTSLQRLGAPVLGVVVNRQKAGHRPYLYTNQSSQEDSLTAKGEGELPTKYPLLRTSHSQPGSVVPRQSPAETPREQINWHIDLEPTSALNEVETKASAANSPYRVPPRPFHLKQPEEQGKH